jgi:hypothetical protein
MFNLNLILRFNKLLPFTIIFKSEEFDIFS